MGGLDRAPDRVVRGALEPEVERQPQLAALDRVGAARAAGVVAVAERVDDHAREAVGAAQVGVVALLDAVLADPRPGLDAAVLLRADLLGRDLAQRAEQLGAELVVGVVAQVLLLDDDAGERLAVLEQVVERRRRDVGPDRHVRRRLVGDPLDHAPVDRPRRYLEHAAEPLVERAQLRRVRRDRADHDLVGAARPRAQLAQPRTFAPRRVAAVGVQPALELAQRPRGGEPPALGGGEPLAVVLGGVELGVGHRVGQDLHDRGGARLDERAAVAVDDVAARRLDLDLADAVLARLDDVVVAGQHLQEPEPEEQHREQHEREAAEHGDAHRELRRDRRAAVLDRRRHLRAARRG